MQSCRRCIVVVVGVTVGRCLVDNSVDVTRQEDGTLNVIQRPMSHVQLCRGIRVARVAGRVAQPFNSRATLFLNSALLYSVLLCRRDAER